MKNICKLMAIAKTYKFNLLSIVVVVCIEVLNRSQKKVIALVCAFIESLNLFKVQKILKRDNIFKVFTV